MNRMIQIVNRLLVAQNSDYGSSQDSETSVDLLKSDVNGSQTYNNESMNNTIWTKFRQLQLILQTTPDLVWLKNADGEYVFCNPAFETLVGKPESVVIGKTDAELLAPDSVEMCADSDQQVLTTGAMVIREEILLDPTTSQPVYLDVRKCPIFNDENQISGVLGFARDMTAQRELQDKLSHHEREFRTLVENSPDLIARYDRNCRHLYVNPALASIFGGASRLLGKAFSEVTPPVSFEITRYEQLLAQVFSEGEMQEFELKCRPDDTEDDVCKLIRLTPEYDVAGNVITVLMVGRDITELNKSRALVQHMSMYDALTGLPNRGLFEDRCQHVIAETVHRSQIAIVMMLNIDNFKIINDGMGHQIGDRLLQLVALRLASCVRSYDTVARVGSDEFALLLPQIRQAKDVEAIAEKTLLAFSEPFLLQDKELYITCSIGVTSIPTDSVRSSDAIKFANSARHLAKSLGGNRYHFYSSKLTEDAQQFLTMQQELRKAVRLNQLELFYQPKVELQSGALNGVEALLRWHHPELGMVSPADFIPVAEETGLIVSIGQWVIQTAAEAAASWNCRSRASVKVSVNISTAQFRATDFLISLQQILIDTGCEPEWLELEVTESLLLNNDCTIQQVFAQLRRLGITIAIDDFGTGYSALSYLHQFAIDSLKIDRQFVNELEQCSRQQELLKVIVGIAKAFELELVAEGIETPQQAELLSEFGCLLGQGYLFSRPVPRQVFEDKWLL